MRSHVVHSGKALMYLMTSFSRSVSFTSWKNSCERATRRRGQFPSRSFLKQIEMRIGQAGAVLSKSGVEDDSVEDSECLSRGTFNSWSASSGRASIGSSGALLVSPGGSSGCEGAAPSFSWGADVLASAMVDGTLRTRCLGTPAALLVALLPFETPKSVLSSEILVKLLISVERVRPKQREKGRVRQQLQGSLLQSAEVLSLSSVATSSDAVVCATWADRRYRAETLTSKLNNGSKCGISSYFISLSVLIP